jgi:hypothetical protein
MKFFYSPLACSLATRIALEEIGRSADYIAVDLATDGLAVEGKAACVALWSQIASDPRIAFELDVVETADDRATIRWTLRKDGAAVARGVNLMRVAGGRIVEARGYTKPVQRPTNSEGAAPRKAAANGFARALTSFR